MPTFEFSAWLTVVADNEEEAGVIVDLAQAKIDEVFATAIQLSLDDSPAIVTDDEEEDL